jgi:hypothetical protein
MVRTEAQKYLGVGQGTFNNFVIKYGIRSEKNGSRLYYNMEDLDKIKAELDERKRIALPPVYKQFKRPDWYPDPRDNYYDLQDICKWLDCTKVYAVNLINASEFKFTKFYTKHKKIYYLKREIDENLINEIRKMRFTKKSKLWKIINNEP